MKQAEQKKIEKFEDYEKEKSAGGMRTRIPDFDLGLEYLGLDPAKEDWDQIDQFVTDWFVDPGKYLKVSDKTDVKVEKRGKFFHFPSVLDETETAKFKHDLQKEGVPGRKVAVIILMHWGGKLRNYDFVTGLLRQSALPVSTFIHVPAAISSNLKKPRFYESVTPNVGKTIYRTMQDAQDIQYFAKHLKNELGFDEVGLLTYSLGTQRGIFSSINYPELFDFAVFNLITDDFTEAVVGGVATKGIADKLENNIDYSRLERLWSTISPGAYEDYLKYLPNKTRIVRSKYDYVFGPANEKKIVDKILEIRPDVEVEVAQKTHYGIGDFPRGLEIMWNNLRFIYESSEIKECKRAKIFLGNGAKK